MRHNRQISLRSTAELLRNSAPRPSGAAGPCPTQRPPTLWRSPTPCGLKATCGRGGRPNRLNRPAVPLSRIQSDILRLLTSHRDPESYVAGSTPLTRSTARYSADIYIFHDREERVAQAAQADSAFLGTHGFALKWLRRDPLIYTVLAERAGEATKHGMGCRQRFPLFPDRQR